MKMKSYADRDRAARGEKSQQAFGHTGAFIVPLIAEPQPTNEALALELVREKFPRHVTVGVDQLVDLFADWLKSGRLNVREP